MNSDFLFKPNHKLSTYFEERGEVCRSNTLLAAQYRHIEKAIKEAENYDSLASTFEITLLDSETRLFELKFQKIRVIHFTYLNDTFVFLGTFRKQTRKTPPEELEKNTKRIREYEEQHHETSSNNR